jgi:hypothetical protein
METVVGIFQQRTDAERARLQLHLQGVDNDKIATFSPGTSDRQVQASVRTSDSEAAGMGGALGGTVGAAVGAASGATLAVAATSLFIPGVGPVLVAGVLGATLFGATGAFAGAMVGNALEHGLAEGLPHDDLFVYEDALRKGRSVLMVAADDGDAADRVRGTLTQAGAESVDAAREDWWIGLQDAEREKYEGDFEQDGVHYRKGFETALRPPLRGKPFEEATTVSDQVDESSYTHKAFRFGYERGQAHQKTLEHKYTADRNPEDPATE